MKKLVSNKKEGGINYPQLTWRQFRLSSDDSRLNRTSCLHTIGMHSSHWLSLTPTTNAILERYLIHPFKLRMIVLSWQSSQSKVVYIRLEFPPLIGSIVRHTRANQYWNKMTGGGGQRRPAAAGEIIVGDRQAFGIMMGKNRVSKMVQSGHD